MEKENSKAVCVVKNHLTLPVGELIYRRMHEVFEKVFSHPVHFRFPKQFRLYMPSIAIRLVEEYVAEEFYGRRIARQEGQLKTFRGVPIFEGYEKSIVLAHERAVEYPDENLVFKVPL